MVNSRAKGARGELEAAHFLTDNFGIAARRGKQFSGSEDSPDVVTELSGVQLEVKRVQSLNLSQAYKQAQKDAGPNNTPIVMHRKNGEEWFFTFKVIDLPKVMKAFSPYVKA